MEIRKVGADQLEELTELRIKVLRAANKLSGSADLSAVEKSSREYFRRGFETDSFSVYFAYEGERVVGCGGVSFYEVMPTCDYPDGSSAYIMNMYTDPEFRRRGIAYAILDVLISECRARKVGRITLEATDMGRPLYEKYGFVKLEHEMAYAKKEPAAE